MSLRDTDFVKIRQTTTQGWATPHSSLGYEGRGELSTGLATGNQVHHTGWQVWSSGGSPWAVLLVLG